MSRLRTMLFALGIGIQWAGNLLAGEVSPPPPCGVVPSARQLAWQELEFYGFIHFTVNTFTDKEWGYGNESESVFNPTALDARQWARTARDAGMKGLIITAKHHDGFCLWPSSYTEHSVKKSPWKNGHGDVIKDLSDACREYGLKLGVYLSPWDRNRSDYATPAYPILYREQLRELLSNYGPIFEVWCDGANGGDGFYGGAREKRKIDPATYYDWPATRDLVRSLQPDAVIFSDAGPDVRWVGNEKGVGYETNWMTLEPEGLYPGIAPSSYVAQYAAGQPGGSSWVPPEVDVSIRPGWFYHANEDKLVKSQQNLIEIYYNSVGRDCSLLLNLPPDRRGLIHESDVASLMALRRYLDETFKTDLASGAKVTASNTRGGDSRYGAANVLAPATHAYWATDDNVTTGSIELELNGVKQFDQVMLQENIALGQRVEAWSLDAQVDGHWMTLSQGSTIGYKSIARFTPVRANKVRLNISKARASLAISKLGLFLSSKDSARQTGSYAKAAVDP
jgi:alpha-L-fucosidase